jgi:hypothetical protein
MKNMWRGSALAITNICKNKRQVSKIKNTEGWAMSAGLPAVLLFLIDLN